MQVRFVYFGGSSFSTHVLHELKRAGFTPVLEISSARDRLSAKTLREVGAEVFVVASFGKILPKEIIYLPEHQTLNVHPSLLPSLRGPAPIQEAIRVLDETGVTIIRMDEETDHGPILAQRKVPISPWPDYYNSVEEKLGRAGGKLLAEILPSWLAGEIQEKPQDDSQATYSKLIHKEDGLLNLAHPAEVNFRKVLAYSRWPGAYFFHRRQDGREVRVIVTKAEVKGALFTPLRVIPAGKKEMPWTDFLRGNE